MLKNVGTASIAFERFAKAVIRQAKSNLTRGKHRDKDKLYKSLDNYELKVTKNSLYLAFFMEEYGEYQDRGVKGAANFKSHKMARFTPFRFKDKMPPIKSLKGWAKRKGLNEYAVQRSVYKKGIPQTLFFTKPFENNWKNLPETVLDAFGRDVDDMLKFATQRKR